MKRITILLLLISLLGISFAGCQAQYKGGTYTDDAGRSITITNVPQRIVSHVPAITEMLYALGLGNRVVGVSDYADYPPQVKEKPKVGNYYNPSIEKIAALNPDLVVTDGESQDIQQLDNLNIKYIVINPQNIQGIYKDIEMLGKIENVEQKATSLVDSMKAQVNDVTAKVKGLPGVKVFYALDMTDPNNPWTAGPGSFIDWMINTAGGINVASQASGPYVQFSIENVVSENPDVIIYPATHGTETITPDTFKSSPIWSKLTAVKDGKIFSVDADLVSRNGPRITQGLLEIAKIIHPEAFK